VDFEAHAAGISHQRGSWLACRREILLNSGSILPKTRQTERYTLYGTVRFLSFVNYFKSWYRGINILKYMDKLRIYFSRAGLAKADHEKSAKA
jgi:hypothetical protein